MRYVNLYQVALSVSAAARVSAWQALSTEPVTILTALQTDPSSLTIRSVSTIHWHTAGAPSFVLCLFNPLIPFYVTLRNSYR
jgi:hypothetical protein